MDLPINNNTTDGISLIKVKEETKFVLEAFLERSLSHEEGKKVGHVGRTYHDPKKYSHRSFQDENKMASPKKTKKSDRKKSKEPGREKEESRHSPNFVDASVQEKNSKWNSIHEDINRVEETKHGFKTNIKRLLRRQEKASTPKERHGSVHSKSRDSVENVLDDSGKGGIKGGSLKRQKPPHPLLACTMAGSTDSMAHEEQSLEKHSSHGAQKKHSKGFSFKNLLKKKSNKEPPPDTDSPPTRPNFLPLKPCYEKDPTHITGKDENSEIYNLAAVKLEKLVKHQKLKSPVAAVQHPVIPSSVDEVAENNNMAASASTAAVDKEELIRKLVALLQEQAVVINETISNDPFLRSTLTRMSYNSFHRLAEVFTSQTEVQVYEAGSSVSPELTKIALTMELTRKVAGITSYPVQTLMGYSMQYMDMFIPWLQKQGGWENIVSHGDLPDFQLD